MRRLKIIFIITEICLLAVFLRQSSAQTGESLEASVPLYDPSGENGRADTQMIRSYGEFSWKNYTTIAHALGGMDGYAYLNCPEGFINAYEKGCRLFEVDLTKTADGIWVCRHSWQDAYGQWEGERRKKLTLEEFLAAPLYGKYTPMTFQDLLNLIRDYPDAYILLDTKHYSFRNYQSTLQDYADLAVLAADAGAQDILGQMIPEIYNEAMLTGIVQIYDFP